MERLTLNIQKFADEEVVVEETSAEEVKSEETSKPTFTELLNNPEYQREFDKLVNKSLTTAKTKWESEFNARLQAEKSEAEKLAQMDATQKINYQLEKAIQERDAIQSELNATNLYRTASQIASERGLPNGYLDLIDFKNEDAESLTKKIDKISELRQNDIQNYLNNKLRQATPQEKKLESKKVDPYVEGFMSEFYK